MAQIVKLRRSSVSGQKPTNTNLQLGELALNTTDGKVFFAKSGSLGPTVEELVSTNTTTTGSIYLTGDVTASNFTGSFKGDGSQLYNIPSSGVTGLELNKIVSGSATASISPNKGLEINTNTTITGSLTVSGSGNFIGTQIVTGSLYTSGSNELVGNTILSGTLKVEGQYPVSAGSQSVSINGNVDMNGFLKFDPVSSNIDNSISGAYLYVTSSTGDLYFAQNIKGFNNTTRLRWLEGNMYTGLLSGGVITATNGGTTFNVAKGTGIIVHLNTSLTDDPYPTTNYVEWEAFTGQTLTYRTTNIQTFIGIDSNGQIHQQPEAFNDGQYNSLITLGTVIHQNLSTVNASITYPNVAYGYKQRTYDFVKAFGGLKLSGLNILTSGSLGLNVGSGTAWADGRNYQNDPDNPSYIIDSGTAVSKIFRYYQVSGTTFVQDTNNGAGYTSIDPTKYVNNGVLTNVGGGYTIQRIFWYPNSATKGIVVYYGNGLYSTAREAIDNITIETFVEVENTKQNAIYLGAIIIAGNGDFTDTNKYSIVPGGLFRNVGGSGGGGAIPTSRLVDLTDVDVTNANNGDLLRYNDITSKWEHSKQLSGSYQITGSLTTIGSISASSITGSIDYSNITNKPTLVSGSSQINITGTTGYSTFSGSISSSIGSLSSSIATTTNDLDGRLDSIEGVTGSYATTGSNQFNGDQSISGSVNIGSGSLDITSPEVLHVGNSGSYNIARFDGYDNNYAQINIKNHHSGSGASTDFVLTADNGTENIHYVDLGINSSNYNAGYVGRENDAYLLNAGKDLYVGTIGGSGHPSNLNLFAQNKWETPQIHVSGSGQVGFNTLIIASGYTYEFSGSIKANNDLNIVGDVSASVFTGSFSGDGSGLYNIPASGVTGIELNKIVSGSVSASISPDNGLQINTDVFIDGTLTAKELHIDYVTSSVLYQSGSTKFGDTSDDVHSFTGSVNISGSINVDSITGSIDFTNLTNLPTLVSGSSQISYTGITDVPSGIVSGSQQISYTEITDIPLGIVSGSSQVIDLGFVTTSSFETFTGSYNTHSESFDSRINLITGSIESLNTFSSSVVLTSETASMSVLTSSYALTASYALNVAGGGGGGASLGAYQTLTQTIAANTWSFNHNIGQRYPIFQVFDDLGNVIIPTQIKTIDNNNAQIIFGSPQTGNVIASLGGGNGTTEGFTNSNLWVVDHNLGTDYPDVTIWDSNRNIIFPNRIESVDTNQIKIYFSVPVTGHVSVSRGGHVLSGTSTAAPGTISGSLQIANLGYATTGSNTFTNNQTINGSLLLSNSLFKQTTTSGSTGNVDITTISTTSYDGAFFDYVLKDGTNYRAGSIMSVWDGTTVKYNEATTNDIGNTSGVTMSVVLNGTTITLRATISSGTWTFKTITRGI